MSIQNKIFLVLIPLFLIALITTGSISAIATKSSLVRTGVRTMSLKASQLNQNINESWTLLQTNNITLTPEYLDNLIQTAVSFAATLIQNTSESIFILDSNNQQILSTSTDPILDKEIPILIQHVRNTEENNVKNNENRHWISNTFKVANADRVGYFISFEELQWLIFITDTQKSFFAPVNQIILITAIITIVTIVMSIIIIILFANTLVTPIKQLGYSMQNIIKTNNFTERVDILYNDEVGKLSTTFNTMVEALENAYKQIKQYAFRAMFAKRQENKIRNIFQKYVPNTVINELFKNPANMLDGKNQELAIMFTDIRQFTTIAESYKPDELVVQLNFYFEKLVEIITNNNGIVDKYIGDAIMAFFGAPMPLENSALAAIQSAIQMDATLNIMNEELSQKNKPQFLTGIGVNFGEVTIGNIGSEKKMDYTIIGDAVNLCSRLEGLTKQYKTNLIFSETVYNKVNNAIPCRIVDAVQVKGKTVGQKIYTTSGFPTAVLLDAYNTHNQAIKLYFKQDFSQALLTFQKVKELIPDDYLAQLYIDRCKTFMAHPPAQDWDGVFIMSTK